MSKNKKTERAAKEEEQANKVIKIVFVSLIIVGLLMVVGFSFFGR